MQPFARLWTWAGHAFIPLAIAWAYFARGGGDTAVPAEALISRGYWGLLVSLGAAALLAGAWALYVRAARRSRNGACVPPNTTFEDEQNRSPLISWTTAAVFVLMVASAVSLFAIRYGDSRIHAWNGTSPLADGFLSSRSEAYRLGCGNPPCFAIAKRIEGPGKPFAGVNEYVLYVSDGALLIAALAALVGVVFLIVTLAKRRSPPPETARGLPQAEGWGS